MTRSTVGEPGLMTVTVVCDTQSTVMTHTRQVDHSTTAFCQMVWSGSSQWQASSHWGREEKWWEN